MSGKLPPLLALQAFEAAARYENFAAAANELNLSQSAVSHRVRGLERHLGYALFERLPRGLRLTEAAKAYLLSVRRAFEDILGATSGVFGQSGEAVLKLRAPISYTALWLTGLVGEFQEEFPHIEVQLTSTIWADKTAAGEADIEFRIGHGRWPGFEAHFLFRDRLSVVGAPEVARRRQAPLDAAALAELPLAHVMGAEDYWGLFFSRAGIERANDRRDIRVDSSLSAAELAGQGAHAALIHHRFAEHYVQRGQLAYLSQDQIEPDEAVFLVRPERAQRRMSEAILFENWLRQKYPPSNDTTGSKEHPPR